MDEGLKRDYRLKLLCNSPITFYGQKLHIPSLQDMSSMGYSEYAERLFIFTLSEDFVKQIPNYSLSLFTTIILVEEYRKKFIKGLCYFFDLTPNDISIDVKVIKDESTGFEDYAPVIKFKKIYINEFRFKELKELILLITNNEELKINKKEEKQLKIKAEYRKRYEAFLRAKAEYENKEKQKEQGMELYKMIVYLATKTKYNLDYIVSLNLEQFNALFLGELAEEKNAFEMTKLSTGVIMSKDLDLKSLYERIKQAIK